MVFRVNEREFEIYLSSNGAVRIEEELGCSFSEILDHKLQYKSMVVLIYGCLYERNKLSLNQVGNLLDEYLKTQKISDLSKMVNSELLRFSGTIKLAEEKSIEDDEDKKK